MAFHHYHNCRFIMYQEPQPTRKRLGLLILTAAILYFFGLGILEIRLADEAFYAALSRSVIQGQNIFPNSLSGVEVKAFPLYPWLVTLCAGLKPPVTALAVRLPALLSIWGLATLAGLTARRLKDNQAGFIAAAVVLFSFASMKMGLRGQPEPLHALIITAAWIVWYLLGPQKQQWTQAWLCSLALVFLDIMTIGAQAIILFYLPILLTRVPHLVKRQLIRPPHLLSLGLFLLVLFIYLTTTGLPIWGQDDVCTRAASKFYTEGFFHHLVFFPLKFAVYFLPWTMFAWSPFCEAQLQYEPKGSPGGFLRAIVVPLFVICWLLPSRSALHLMPLLGPMAILIGFHFEITVRRLHDAYTRIMDWAAWGLLIFAGLALCFWLVLANPNWLVHLTSHLPSPRFLADLNKPLFVYFPIVFTVFITARYLLPRHDAPSFSVGTRLLLTVLGTGLLSIATFMPYKGMFTDYRCDHAYALMKYDNGKRRAELAKLTTAHANLQDFVFDRDVQKIYLNSPELFLAESFYFHCPVKFVASPATDIPADEETVYLLTSELPIAPERSWDIISGPIDMTPKYELARKIRLRLYRGKLRPLPQENQDVQPDNVPNKPNDQGKTE